MKIFIDSADLSEIDKYVSWGICDGVTTNPTIFLKAGVTGGAKGMKKRATEIAKLVSPRSYSVEVTSDEPKEILKQAKELSTLGKNVAVKVTITDQQGNSLLPVIHELAQMGITVNVTAMMTLNQLILAAKALDAGRRGVKEGKRTHYISVFAGRISEEHGVERAFKVIQDMRSWLDFHRIDNIEIIVGSVRSPENVEYWSRSGAHILTIPPEILPKLTVNARTKETVQQFMADAEKSLSELSR